MSKKVGLFCIGHRPPSFQVPHPFTHVTPVAPACPSSLVVPDEVYGDLWHGKIISEYVQLFALADAQSLAKFDALFLFQYRKFMALVPAGRVSENLPYARAASAADAVTVFPAPAELVRLGSNVLIGPAARVRSVAHQYGRHHLVEDFAAFCAALGSLKAYPPQRLARFIASRALFPSPSIGLFPVDLFRKHVKELREAWQAFAGDYYVPRDGYQRRVGGFLLERLHGFLLAEMMESGSLRPLIGHRIIVSEAARIEPTI